jgi:TetR/AcrR family transcriptional regulator, cholesterol catabolism regulator
MAARATTVSANRATAAQADAEPRISSRSKRAAILETATQEFARTGYRASKWSDVADAVGIGSTALYHYFVSKDHCLFTIMADVLRDNRDFFDRLQDEGLEPSAVIEAAMRHPFDGGDLAAQRHRLVMAEMHLLALDHKGPEREHAAYLEARTYAHDIVRDWTRYLQRCMREGAIPSQDPHLLARALIGLSSYVFSWYVPGGSVSADAVSDAVVAHALAVTFHSAAPK